MPERSAYSFTAHMVIHLGVVVLASGAISLAIAGTRFDLTRRFGALRSPIVASVVEGMLVWAWHAPFLHGLARHTVTGFWAEQLSFLIAGLWLWLSAFGYGIERNRQAGAGIAGLLLTSMHMTLLGALLALAPRPLFGITELCATWLSPLQDQQLGGTLMLLVGGAAYLWGGLYLAKGLLASKRSEIEV